MPRWRRLMTRWTSRSQRTTRRGACPSTCCRAVTTRGASSPSRTRCARCAGRSSRVAARRRWSRPTCRTPSPSSRRASRSLPRATRTSTRCAARSPSPASLWQRGNSRSRRGSSPSAGMRRPSSATRSLAATSRSRTPMAPLRTSRCAASRSCPPAAPPPPCSSTSRNASSRTPAACSRCGWRPTRGWARAAGRLQADRRPRTLACIGSARTQCATAPRLTLHRALPRSCSLASCMPGGRYS